MLVNTKEMLLEAKKGNYAIPHFNIINLEIAKYVLEECEKQQCPAILGVTEGALKHMGGANVVVGMVKGLLKELNITIPVALHIDHGTSFDTCKKAIDAGFTSVMIDASKYELDENIRITKEVVDYAHQFDVTVEAEVGHVGGVEDNISATNLNATLEESVALVNETGIDLLTPAVGTAHGIYKGVPVIDFDLIKKIGSTVSLPIVLHGGSGVPESDIRKAISNGINKINIDTEIRQAWQKGVAEFIQDNPNVIDPRKIIGNAEQFIKKVVNDKIKLFSGNE